MSWHKNTQKPSIKLQNNCHDNNQNPNPVSLFCLLHSFSHYGSFLVKRYLSTFLVLLECLIKFGFLTSQMARSLISTYKPLDYNNG